ncbi:MAG: cyclase family protein [Bdellovibrionota bacterium]
MKTLDSMQILDITPVINTKMAVFPGDIPFSQEFAMNMINGDHLTLSSIKTTVHLGAHTDAPNHYSKDGAAIENRSLDYYLGPAQVIEVKCRMGQRITVSDVVGKNISAARVLFKTNSFPDPYKWNSDFMSLSEELVNYLAEQKVKLVGIDTPSIDLSEDKILQSHHAVAKNDMAILEGIVLSRVDEGIYQLIALPLKIEGADATPVRAVLLK